MDEAKIAGLRRKHAATHEPAKRNELRNLLLVAGVDPDAKPVETAPEGRTAPKLQTTAPTKPVAKAAPEPKETSKETAAKTSTSRRRTTTTPKTETSK